jgi:hypothetical protein
MRFEAQVVDRSLGGLGIVVPLSFARGTYLKVQPRDVREKTVQVEVRNCRRQGRQWLIGCHFPDTPPADLLMLLG